MFILSKRFRVFDSKEFTIAFQRRHLTPNILDLSIGLPDGRTPLRAKRAGIQAIKNNHTTYQMANGMPKLRAALAQKLATRNNLHYSPEAITVVPGLTTGLMLAYMAVLDPGDEIIVTDPYYPPYTQLATALGAVAVRVPALPDFQLDLKAITASITTRTKAIVVNSPNNPTGAVYGQASLETLAKIAAQHNLLIISDEIYESLVYEGAHFSIGSIYANTLSMHGFSKEYAMTGWRIGYMSGPDALIEAINVLQQYIVFSSSSISQHAALAAIRRPVGVSKSYIRKNMLVRNILHQAGYILNGASGAYYAFLQLPSHIADTDFTDLAYCHNVLLIPGKAFSVRRDFVRLAYGAIPYKELEKAVQIISKLRTNL